MYMYNPLLPVGRTVTTVWKNHLFSNCKMAHHMLKSSYNNKSNISSEEHSLEHIPLLRIKDLRLYLIMLAKMKNILTFNPDQHQHLIIFWSKAYLLAKLHNNPSISFWDGWMDRWTVRQTNRQTDREANRLTD